MELGSTRVLANWQPSELTRETIRVEFTEFAQKLIRKLAKKPTKTKPYVWVRSPEQNVYQGLHHDCYGHAQYLLMWSNILPTLVRFGGKHDKHCNPRAGDWLKTRKGDVILLNNREAEHDAPASVQTMIFQNRWFARIYITPTGRFRNNH